MCVREDSIPRATPDPPVSWPFSWGRESVPSGGGDGALSLDSPTRRRGRDARCPPFPGVEPCLTCVCRCTYPPAVPCATHPKDGRRGHRAPDGSLLVDRE